MVKSLLLNSSIGRDKNSSLAFNCSYASSVLNKIRNPLTFCGIHLQLRNPEQLALFACCGKRKKTNVPTKFTSQVYVCGIHWKFVCGIHLHFGTYFKTCLWNPGTYRHKIVLLSSAQFGLVKVQHVYSMQKIWYSKNSFRVFWYWLLNEDIDYEILAK